MFLARPVPRLTRSLASIAANTPSSPFQVFDRSAKILQKNRSAADVNQSRTVDYVRDEVADRLIERLMVRNLSQFIYH